MCFSYFQYLMLHMAIQQSLTLSCVFLMAVGMSLVGCDSDSEPSTPLTVRWAIPYETTGAPLAIPLVVGDSLVVASAGFDLVCVRVQTGEVKWRTQVTDDFPLQTSSLVTDGERVYTSHITAQVEDFRAYDLATGALVWQRPVDGNEVLSVSRYAKYAAADGAFYAGDVLANVYAFDGATGDLRWKAELDSASADGITSHDGRLFLGRGRIRDGDLGFVTALDAATGEELWSFFRPSPFFGTPPHIDGDGVIAIADSVYRLDLATGRLAWVIPAPGGADAWLEDDGRYIYGSGATPWKVEKATGRLAWRSPDFVGGGGFNVVELGGRVYHARGDVAILDAETGRLQSWESTPGYTWWVAEAGGLVISQEDHQLTAYEPGR